MSKHSPVLNITSYNNILALLDKPMTTCDLMSALNISKEMCNYYLHKLRLNKYIERSRDETIESKNSKLNPYFYTRLVERIEGLEVKGKYTKIPDEEKAPPLPNVRFIAERHVKSERKKSPRVYVGCSFNLAGW